MTYYDTEDPTNFHRCLAKTCPLPRVQSALLLSGTCGGAYVISAAKILKAPRYDYTYSRLQNVPPCIRCEEISEAPVRVDSPLTLCLRACVLHFSCVDLSSADVRSYDFFFNPLCKCGHWRRRCLPPFLTPTFVLRTHVFNMPPVCSDRSNPMVSLLMYSSVLFCFCLPCIRLPIVQMFRVGMRCGGR